MPDEPATRTMTVIAQDPEVRIRAGRAKKILTVPLTIPYEDLGPGPQGYRVMVVDYDSSRRVLYEPPEFDKRDRYARASDDVFLSDPKFHAQNVYAIIMWLLARFEFALGRRVSWGFGGHQLYVAPHAFYEPNAYYSEDAHGLLFGYFHGKNRMVHACLSHDIIAHETTHALLDGLRDSYTLAAHPDQAGFHEGFADTVALLSVFAHKEVVEQMLKANGTRNDRLPVNQLTQDGLRRTALMKFAEEFGVETGSLPGQALRNAATRPPKEDALLTDDFEEAHRRGEVLTAAMIHAFLAVWAKRLKTWIPKAKGKTKPPSVNITRVAEDGADAADHLLTMAIRAVDYCPVVDVTFGDFLSALLTADREVVPDDGKYGYREVLPQQFARWYIQPASRGRNLPGALRLPETGVWERPNEADRLRYDCVHRESLQRDRDEVFRFIWENRKVLGVYERAYTRVISVRPCLRVGPDGFPLRETVCEYLQTHNLRVSQLWRELRIRKPRDMPGDKRVRLYGGGVLVFDEFGHLKYHVRSRLNNRKRQEARLKYLWENRIKGDGDQYGAPSRSLQGRQFALMHLRRAGRLEKGNEWDE